MNRTLAVLRVQALDHAQVYWPWAIMASSFVINVMLWIGLSNVQGYDKTTGGLSALYVTAGIVAGCDEDCAGKTSGTQITNSSVVTGRWITRFSVPAIGIAVKVERRMHGTQCPLAVILTHHA